MESIETLNLSHLRLPKNFKNYREMPDSQKFNLYEPKKIINY